MNKITFSSDDLPFEMAAYLKMTGVKVKPDKGGSSASFLLGFSPLGRVQVRNRVLRYLETVGGSTFRRMYYNTMTFNGIILFKKAQEESWAYDTDCPTLNFRKAPTKHTEPKTKCLAQKDVNKNMKLAVKYVAEHKSGKGYLY